MSNLEELLAQSRDWWKNATPEEREKMRDEQRKSWVRAMTTPCEHGVLDFEQCLECRNPSKDKP